VISVGRSRPAIIGVIGKSDTRDTHLLKLARDVGRSIALAGHIVLTGGHYRGSDESVKHYALLGAKSVATAGGTARAIGILPAKLSKDLRYTGGMIESSIDRDGRFRYFCLHTGLTSEQRNLITGSAPDVLIAMYGENGTAQEVSIAIHALRPVVFLNSLAEITRRLPKFHVSVPAGTTDATTAGQAIKRAQDAIARKDAAERPPQDQFPDAYPELKAAYTEALRNLL
jgi:uncharacterized protein (TIGR00725 family)